MRECEVSVWSEEKPSRFPYHQLLVGLLNLNSQSHKALKALGSEPKAEFPQVLKLKSQK